MTLFVWKKMTRVRVYEQHKLPYDVFSVEYYDGTYGRLTEESFNELKAQHTEQLQGDKKKADKIYQEDMEKSERSMQAGMESGIDAYNDMNGDS
tara:strand:- start:1891 stop:2172 length:282 start_codon:yes stop_codon:yes gene_type:complete